MTLKPFPGVGLPPSREDTLGTLERRPPGPGRRKKSGRTEQFNSRVRPGFKLQVEEVAEGEGRTIGAVLEDMLALYKAKGGQVPGAVPAAEAREGRTHEVRIFATEAVLMTAGRVAGELGMSVSALFEDLLARGVARLDPHGGKFGVKIAK